MRSFTVIIKHSITVALLAFVVAGCNPMKAQPINFGSQPYFFDAGGANSNLAEGKYPITPDLVYSKELGYGWTSGNLKEFYHEATEESRGDFLVDGVIGSEVGFKADIPSGDWWLTIWFEGGIKDSVASTIRIQGEIQEFDLQAFQPHAEAREEIQKMYRVVQKKIRIEDEGLVLNIKGNDDQVRLLGIGLVPAQEPQNQKQEELLSLIEQTGLLNSDLNIESVRRQLAEVKDEPGNASFVTHWDNQLGILSKAQEFFYMRGWSWASDSTNMSLFDHLHQSVMIYDGILAMENAEEHPLYERALWYRGRLLYWLYLERGGSNEKRGADRDIAKLYQLHGDNDLVAMYSGRKIDSPDEFDEVPKEANTPEWASTQWELTNRLKSIVDWWVNVQQDENGEFGGKFGDDVEILRWWSPLILSGDETTYKGWKKLADGVWNSSKVKNGYAKKPSDVEHSSEFISDTAPLMVLYNDDPVYADRLAYSSDYFQNLWTGYNSNGNRFFKSAWFSSSEVEMEEPKNRDVSYNARATKAVRYYSWKTNDSDTRAALIEWADSWLDISKSTQKGKPEGIIPPSVEFPSEVINGKEPTWYLANMYWDYFDWNGSNAILDQLLFTWTFTGDDKYLEPLMQHLELLIKYKDELDADSNPYEEGSEGWATYKFGNKSQFWNVVENWRLLSGNTEYDALILEHGSDLIKYRITKNEKYLVEAMRPYLETVRVNVPMLTSEVIHTDRVYIKDPGVREAGILQGMITGFGADESSSPYIAVSWEKASRDLTFLVTDSDSTHLNIDMYSFSDTSESTTMRIWQLKKGSYQVLKRVDGITETIEIEVKRRGDRFEIDIPSKVTVSLSISPVKNK